jgi:hypothetical protein
MTKEEKEKLLALSKNVVEHGHHMCDTLEQMYKVADGLTDTLEEQDSIVDTDEDFIKAQGEMDTLHARMVELGIA